mmetsp:Transcript_65325/g.188130  ORF Transcript_65325/g.188130 Transcript_65325/m.188130 type:complete len:222 (-) Transcript_65325:2186-2851(-)
MPRRPSGPAAARSDDGRGRVFHPHRVVLARFFLPATLAWTATGLVRGGPLSRQGNLDFGWLVADHLPLPCGKGVPDCAVGIDDLSLPNRHIGRPAHDDAAHRLQAQWQQRRGGAPGARLPLAHRDVAAGGRRGAESARLLQRRDVRIYYRWDRVLGSLHPVVDCQGVRVPRQHAEQQGDRIVGPGARVPHVGHTGGRCLRQLRLRQLRWAPRGSERSLHSD